MAPTLKYLKLNCHQNWNITKTKKLTKPVISLTSYDQIWSFYNWICQLKSRRLARIALALFCIILFMVNILYSVYWEIYFSKREYIYWFSVQYTTFKNNILYPYKNERMDTRSNIPLCLKAKGYIWPYIPSRVLIWTVYHFNSHKVKIPS